MKHLRTIAALTLLTLPLTACGSSEGGQDPAARPTSSASGSSLSGSACHLSPEEVANWGETGSRLGTACDGTPPGDCHLSQEEVANWGETGSRLETACNSDE